MKKFGGLILAFCFMSTLVGCNTLNKENASINNVEKVKPTVETQSIGLTGVENARQLGGYIGADGKKVKNGMLLRSGKLSKASDEDIKKLKDDYKLNYIVDFRTTNEIEKEPDPKVENVEARSIKVLEEDSSSNSSTTMVNIYSEDPVKGMIEMVQNGTLTDEMYVTVCKSEQAQKGYSEFFKVLLENEDGSILWHCTGGKDRAGVASVLVLSALGVDRDTILEDFDLTNAFYSKKIDYMGSEAAKHTDDETVINGVKILTGVDKSYMEKMLDTIDNEYGSIDKYLEKAIGLTEGDIKKLQEKYLE